jgi:hypothetical protein
MKSTIHTLLTVFYTSLLILEFVALLLDDFSLATALRLLNFIFIAFVYYTRYSNYRRTLLTWYIFVFAVIDTLFYLFILIFVTRRLFIFLLLLVALVRIFFEYHLRNEVYSEV